MAIDFDSYRGLPAAPMSAVIPFIQTARVNETIASGNSVDIREGPPATPAPGLGWMDVYARLMTCHFQVTEAPTVDVEPLTLTVRVDNGLGTFYGLDHFPLYVNASQAQVCRIEGYVIPAGWNILLSIVNQTTTDKTVTGMVQLRSVI